eukprot:1702836-Pleurochrysis_carterae.AAC.1
MDRGGARRNRQSRRKRQLGTDGQIVCSAWAFARATHMGLQAKAKRIAKSPPLCTRLRSDTWSGLRTDVLRHDACYVLACARFPRRSSRALDAALGFRSSLPSGRPRTWRGRVLPPASRI